MSLLSPEVANESTLEHEIWNVEFFQFRDTATDGNQFGATAFSGNLGYEPQIGITGVARPYPYFGQVQPLDSSAFWLAPMIAPFNFRPMMQRWISVNIHEIFSATNLAQTSLPLTGEELYDIHRGLEEIKLGKAKHFKSVRETLDWLHRERTK